MGCRQAHGSVRKLGDEPGCDMTDLAITGWGSRMGWVVRLIEMGTDKPARNVDVLEFGQPRDFGNPASLGLTLTEAEQLLARVSKQWPPRKLVIMRSYDRTAQPAAVHVISRTSGSIRSRHCLAR